MANKLFSRNVMAESGGSLSATSMCSENVVCINEFNYEEAWSSKIGWSVPEISLSKDQRDLVGPTLGNYLQTERAFNAERYGGKSKKSDETDLA